MQKKEYKTTIGGAELSVQLSSIAEQASAAVIAQHGETVVLATAVMSKEDKPMDYFPLRVDYEERFYAAGKIIGSRFVRREARPSEEAILGGRLIDRTIRPLFDHRMRRDVQVVITVLAYDEAHEPELPGLVAASLALGISDIPWGGPVAGFGVVKTKDNLIFGPSRSEAVQEGVRIDAFVAGPKGKVNMIELGGAEASEDEIVEAFKAAQKEIDRLVEFQEDIIKKEGKPKADVKLKVLDPELRKLVEAFVGDKLEDALYPHASKKERTHALDKVEREHRLRVIRDELKAHLQEKIAGGEEIDLHSAEILLDDLENDVVHKNIVEGDKRPDGRKLDEIRPLEAEVKLFDRTHGSALFVRGNTQALAVTTLAAPGAEQLIETMETTGKRRFMLHYNFPSFSVGEIGPFRGPGRREIGHGALAHKALQAQLPTQEEFPYTIRVVSEILSSNGSSSMATVCATSLSLMDAGVPMKKHTAGIAMGLMVDQEKKKKYKVLTDIQGPEDHFGDMDFKVAGTADGVTAVQLDVKNEGITEDMIRDTLAQAKKARLEILGVMGKVLPAARPELSKYAPTVLRHVINPDQIGLVIGPGGKTINGLIAKYSLAGIDIEEDGRVFVSATDVKAANAAMEEIKMMTKEIKIGDVVEGEIIKIMDFGAIMDLGGGRDGMIHVSELKEGFVKNVKDVVKEGDFVRAKVIRVEDGRIGLSMKQLKE